MDIYQQQRMHYRNFMKINNKGVQQLYNGNVDGAILTFQDGTILARNLLLHTRATILRNMTCNVNPQKMDQSFWPVNAPMSFNDRSIGSCTAYNPTMVNSNSVRLLSTCRVVDRQSQQYVQQQQHYDWIDMLFSVVESASSSTSSSSLLLLGRGYVEKSSRSNTMEQTFTGDATTSAGIEHFRMGAPLNGLKADNYYVHDRAFLFSDNFIDQRCCPTDIANSSICLDDSSAPIDTEEIIRATTLLIVNFALTYHCQGKMYGHAKSYTKAIEMYYLLWTISQSSCIASGSTYNMKDRWNTTIQCILLNNLVHVHNELENYFESKICITCLYDLIVWKSSQQGTSVNDTMDEDECSTIALSEEGSRRGTSPENNIAITYERINRMSFLEQNEFDQIMANVIYYQTPETARAA